MSVGVCQWSLPMVCCGGGVGGVVCNPQALDGGGSGGGGCGDWLGGGWGRGGWVGRWVVVVGWGGGLVGGGQEWVWGLGPTNTPPTQQPQPPHPTPPQRPPPTPPTPPHRVAAVRAPREVQRRDALHAPLGHVGQHHPQRAQHGQRAGGGGVEVGPHVVLQLVVGDDVGVAVVGGAGRVWGCLLGGSKRGAPACRVGRGWRWRCCCRGGGLGVGWGGVWRGGTGVWGAFVMKEVRGFWWGMALALLGVLWWWGCRGGTDGRG